MSELKNKNEQIITGTFSDTQIKKMCKKNLLIAENYKEKLVKQACYELSASNIYYDIVDGNKKYELSTGEFILIKPKQLVSIITHESLELPKDILGRILTKGRLFSIGLLPVNTYADPGFSGKLGIVFYNLSNHYIKIKPEDQIAKIEFSRLQQEVERPYRGQHGYQTKMWPVQKDDYIMSPQEIKEDIRIKNEIEEIEIAYGKGFGSVIKRIFSYEKYLIYATIAYMMFTVLLIGIMIYKGADGQEIILPIVSVTLGVASNLIFAFIVYISTNYKRKR